ncbi:LptA/OstA family protein [Fischerella sp. JS2]|uniref:LptA/OstA family protein n=1 Tax=Fischerella sp. JS2 TaxID=2597771 RepID=UPI0028ED0A6A|nr:LptA/OstA family protein [Fischerella sp. JS2]
MISWYQLFLLPMRRFGLAFMLPAALFGAIAFPSQLQTATAQTSAGSRPLTIHSDVQEYDAKTQVATARGNVQMVYEARGIQATAAQAQYFSKERRIVLSGNVYILQKGGNSIRGETVTYLIDEGRFVATPKSGRQVESIYIVNDSQVNQATTPAPNTPPLQRSN